MEVHEFDSLPGDQFERVLEELLVQNGFTEIEYTPKSADFGADIISKKDGQRYAIQVKRSSSSPW